MVTPFLREHSFSNKFLMFSMPGGLQGPAMVQLKKNQVDQAVK
jgi:hypothetical protein